MCIFQVILFASSFAPVAKYGVLISLNVPYLIFGLIFTAVSIYFLFLVSITLKFEILYIKSYNYYIGQLEKEKADVKTVEMNNVQ